MTTPVAAYQEHYPPSSCHSSLAILRGSMAHDLDAVLKGELASNPKTSFMPKGSMRGSVFNLIAATLGPGALALPYAVSVSGVGFAVFQLIVASLLTIYTIRLLIQAADIAGLKSYEDLAQYAFGRKIAFFVEFSILIFCFGFAVAYLVALGGIVTPLMSYYVGEDSVLAQQWVVMILATTVFMFPLSLLRDVGNLQFTSIFGVCSVIFLIAAVCWRSINYAQDHDQPEVMDWSFNSSSGFDVVLGIPIVMFAFTNHVNVFGTYSELVSPSEARMNQVATYATCVSAAGYLAIGIFAYMAFGRELLDPDVSGNILLNFPLSDTLIAVSRVAVATTVCMAYPLNVLPCRYTIEKMFFLNASSSTTRHMFITFGFVCSSLLVAIFCPGINVVFGILGGTCSSFVCFGLPAAFILKLESGSVYGPKKRGPLLLAVGAAIIGVGTTGVTIWSNFE